MENLVGLNLSGEIVDEEVDIEEYDDIEDETIVLPKRIKKNIRAEDLSRLKSFIHTRVKNPLIKVKLSDFYRAYYKWCTELVFGTAIDLDIFRKCLAALKIEARLGGGGFTFVYGIGEREKALKEYPAPNRKEGRTRPEPSMTRKNHPMNDLLGEVNGEG